MAASAKVWPFYGILPLMTIILAVDITHYVCFGLGEKGGTLTDDCAFFVDILLYVALGVCIYVYFSRVSSAAAKIACALTFYLFWAFTVDKLAHIGIEEEMHADPHHRNLGGDSAEEEPLWMVIMSSACIGFALIAGILWTFVPEKGMSTAFDYVEVIVIAMIFQKVQYLLKIFLLDMEWALSASTVTSTTQLPGLAHMFHVLLLRYELALLAFCVVELLFFIWATYVHKEYCYYGVMITLLIVVICMISAAYAGVNSFAFVSAARTLALLEVVAATIDAFKTMEGWANGHHDEEHHDVEH